MRKIAIEMDRKTVIGSRRTNVIAARNATGNRSRLDPRARRSPSRRRSTTPVKRQRVTKMAKLIPRGFFQNRKSNAHPNRMTIVQKRFGLVFTQASMKVLSKLSPVMLAETLKRYHKSSELGWITVL